MNINEYPLVVLQTELFDLPATADSTALQGNQNTAFNLLGVLTHVLIGFQLLFSKATLFFVCFQDKDFYFLMHRYD